MNNTQSLPAAACPTSDKLLAFSTGKLSVAELEAVGNHLENCRSCLGFLDQRHEKRGRAVDIPGSSDSSKSSLLDETDRELLQAGGPLSRLRARAKAIAIDDSSPTIEWSPTSCDGERTSEAEKLPEAIGDYFVVKRLGKGGFADVYLALDPKDDGQVAIKVPRTDKFKNEHQAEEFLAEARNASEFKHPNILPATFVRLPSGSCLLRMKYIEGSLESAMKSEQLSPEQIAEICAQVAEGLAYAHRKEMIHRDIKPANILLDQQNHPLITDFGLAIREAHQDRHQGERAGTWAYMSPEQIRGESHHLDGRTDVWSLGVILYELLTRQRPFVGKDSVALEEQICRREPKPPRSTNRGIPAELERICLRCLTKDISLRCPSAADLAESLRNWLRSRQRNRRRAVLALAVVLLIGVSGLFAWGVGGSGFGGTQEQDAAKGGTPPQPARTVASPKESKFQLLTQKPEFAFGLPLPDPYHDSNQHLFSVGHPVENPALWIARMDRRLSAPVQLHGTVSLKDWTGLIGFAWQCRDLTKVGENNRWRSVVFFRSHRLAKSWVFVQEITLASGGAIRQDNLFKKELAVPAKLSTDLDVAISPRGLKCAFDGVPFSPPDQAVPPDGWLESGELTLALIAQGQSATFEEIVLELSEPSKHPRK